MAKVLTFSQPSISAASALDWVNQAFQVAKGMDLSIGACVVDVNGLVKAKVMMDGVSLITDELIERKAKTSLLGLNSQDLAAAIEGSAPTVASLTNLADITLMGGGFPIYSDGVLVGGFAVGGALVEQDIACAEAVIAHFA